MATAESHCCLLERVAGGGTGTRSRSSTNASAPVRRWPSGSSATTAAGRGCAGDLCSGVALGAQLSTRARHGLRLALRGGAPRHHRPSPPAAGAGGRGARGGEHRRGARRAGRGRLARLAGAQRARAATRARAVSSSRTGAVSPRPRSPAASTPARHGQDEDPHRPVPSAGMLEEVRARQSLRISAISSATSSRPRSSKSSGAWTRRFAGSRRRRTKCRQR